MTLKESYKRYNESAKGRARRIYYEQSERGKAARMLYIESGRSAEAQRERYHKIQDEFGCHGGDITGILYIGRLIEALINAPVVEIKLQKRIKKRRELK